MKRLTYFLATCLLLNLIAANAIAADSDSLWKFGSDAAITRTDSHVDATLDPTVEQFYVHLPPDYDGTQPFGLIVYTDPGENVNAVPPGWSPILQNRKLLFVAAQKAGNDHPNSRRLGLALMAVKGMQASYKIDKNRIYACGLSGGARIASQLAFFASDVFKGTIQCAGTDFYHAVPKVAATSETDTAGNPYGLFHATPAQVQAARQNVRFALITGSDDFRGGNIRDIFHGGYEKEQFHAKLFDIPGLSHTFCPPRVLSAAIDFIEGRTPATQPALPTPPAWMARDPSDWPQILLTNEIRFSDGSEGQGASAFLMRLPNGVILGATAKHCMDVQNLADVKSHVSLWDIYRPNSHAEDDRIGLTQLAEKVTEGSASDWFVMLCPSQDGPWPALPMPASTDSLEVGDTVYVLAVPEGGNSRQEVFKGVVTDADGSGQFYYTIASAPKSTGFSGAPILDAYGRLAGMHSGHAGIPGKYYGYDTASLLRMIQLPPGAARHVSHETSGLTSPSATPAASTPAASPPAASPPSEADALLRSAQLLITNSVYDKAREKLESIIKTFPNTPAAQKAQKMLSDLPNQ